MLTIMSDFRHRLASLFHVDVSSTLTILRLLEGVLSLCTLTVLNKTFETLQWTLSDRDRGVRLLTLLGMSPTSGVFGTIALAFSRHSKPMDRLAAGTRIILLAAVWTSGVVLFARTRLAIVYDSVKSYNVTSGVGQFNGSYIPEYLQQFQDTNSGYNFAVLPYSTVVTAANLVVNPMHATAIAPTTCKEGMVCSSYLLSGGLMMTTPWPPKDFPSSPVISVKDVPCTQIDYVRGIHDDTFDDAKDCTTFGGQGFLIGIKFCLARSQAAVGSLFAGRLRGAVFQVGAELSRDLRLHRGYERRRMLDNKSSSRSNDNDFCSSQVCINNNSQIKFLHYLCGRSNGANTRNEPRCRSSQVSIQLAPQLHRCRYTSSRLNRTVFLDCSRSVARRVRVD